MEYLQVAIRLLPAGPKISLAANKTMSQTNWYQNRGPANRRIWHVELRPRCPSSR